MVINPWETTAGVQGGKRRTAAVTATPMGTWLAQNTHLKPADNQAPTTTKPQYDKTPWAATWRENTISLPDKQGRHVGK